jgi:hypothetical protein
LNHLSAGTPTGVSGRGIGIAGIGLMLLVDVVLWRVV